MKITDIKPFLLEGIKFGQKEISDILSRAEDFNVGIEYEFRPTDKQEENLWQWFHEYGIGSIRRLEDEHDDMKELVTNKMPVTAAIDHLEKMFKMISDNNIEVPNMAGLHISISTNKYKLSDINMAKFLILMNAEYLHGLYPERMHVRSIASDMFTHIEVQSYDKITKAAISDIEEQIFFRLKNKFQTIKISDYTNVDMLGRIELRFFGGEDYHKNIDQIKQELLRSLFILEIAYTDLHQKQYYREIYDLFFKDEKQLLKDITYNPYLIQDIKYPSENVQLAAVNKYADAIEYIKNPTPKVQITAVTKDINALKHINNKKAFFILSLKKAPILVARIIAFKLLISDYEPIINKYFADGNNTDVLSKIMGVVGLNNETTKYLIDYGFLNLNNIEPVLQDIIDNHNIVIEYGDINGSIEIIQDMMDINTISLDLSPLADSIKSDLKKYIGIIQFSNNTQQPTVLSSIIEYVIKYIIGENTIMSYEQALDTIEKTVIRRPSELLGGILYPMTDEKIAIIKTTLKKLTNESN